LSDKRHILIHRIRMIALQKENGTDQDAKIYFSHNVSRLCMSYI